MNASLLTAVPALPRWSGGTLSAVKWVALALMVLDHVDAFIFGREVLWAGALGRLVFPAFAVVIGYNLARPGLREDGAHGRLLRRLLVFGILAEPFHGALASFYGGWWPLNILLTFAVIVGVVALIERRRPWLAGVLFLVGGAFVEYGWPGVALGLAVYALYRAPGWLPVLWVVSATAALVVVNGSFLALWALPLLWMAAQLDLSAPRAQHVFYWFYPVHLLLFWLVAQ